MRNIFINFTLVIGASLLILGCDFVQSTRYPDSYLTSNEETQRFNDLENGTLVHYRIVPLKSGERNSDSTRVKRQSGVSVTVTPTEQVKSATNIKPTSGVTSVKKATETLPKAVGATSDSTTNSTTGTNLTPSSTGALPSNTNGNNTVTNTSANNNSSNSNVGSSSSSPPPAPTISSNNNNNNNAESKQFDDLDRFYPNYPIFPNSSTTWLDNNVTDTIQIIRNETHTYYNSSTISNGSVYWVDLESHSEAVEHEMLSSAHRRAATIKLKFPFPFYGHIIENVTVATGGFIYLGEHVHAWLAATQYVAVLMANFDSSLSQNASVLFLSTDEQFTVEWHEVHLKDSPKKGPFTFQATLFKNGSIVFVYKHLPISINSIDDQSHPVKVGLSDAYIRDKHVLFVKQKTIYEYDRIDLKSHDGVNIGNWTAIVFTPLKSCLSYKTCYECTHHETTFECSWCPYAKRCSDGTDRYRDDWLTKECEKDANHIKNDEECSSGATYAVNTTSPSTATARSHATSSKIDHVAKTPVPSSENGMSAFGVISVLFLVILIVSAVGWVFYAYAFPHSTSGQLLIRYRPSTWSFRRNSVRYSAASIHM